MTVAKEVLPPDQKGNLNPEWEGIRDLIFSGRDGMKTAPHMLHNRSRGWIRGKKMNAWDSTKKIATKREKRPTPGPGRRTEKRCETRRNKITVW